MEQSHAARTDSGPFAVVPVALLNDPTVDDRALRFYIALSSYADRGGAAWPSQEALAERLHVSVPTVKRGLATLVDAGWVETRKRRDAGGRVIGNGYIVHRVNAQGIRSDPLTRDQVGDPDKGSACVIPTKDQIGDPSIEEQTKRNRPTEPDHSLAPLALVPAPPARRDDIAVVFDAWIEVAQRTERTVLSPKRRRLIRQALAQYPLDDVLDAVRGWLFSDFHCGENPGRKVYNEIELLLRDAEHIEQFRDLARRARPEPGRRVPESWSAIAQAVHDRVAVR